MRKNLDPLNKHTDDEVWQALDMVSLRPAIAAKAEGLGAPVVEGGMLLVAARMCVPCAADGLWSRTVADVCLCILYVSVWGGGGRRKLFQRSATAGVYGAGATASLQDRRVRRGHGGV